MSVTITDLLIIGGGINGCGIAADAAGRGLNVTLCEMNDLASATSSWSSKLIHGGLRYLENYEFKLVREALREREILLRKAPHLIHPLRFILPHEPHLRPRWMIRAGLFMYDHLTRLNKLPKSRQVKLATLSEGQSLKDNLTNGFIYSDCKTDDSRLVILNAIAARDHGANILTRTRFIQAQRTENGWHAELENTLTKEKFYIQAKAIVNAAGPWVAECLHDRLQTESKSHVRLVKGSHIIVPKLYDGKRAFILQNPDNRIVFAIPYFTQFTLIGTTDIAYEGDPAKVAICDDEKHYLCDIINHYFKKPINTDSIISSYSGVRPLYDDRSDNPSKVTREYHLELEAIDNYPLLSVFGGKITTFRTLAEAVLEKLQPYFPEMSAPWTEHSLLPGGDIPNGDFQGFIQHLSHEFPWLPDDLALRYASNYGTLCYQFLSNCHNMTDLGRDLGAGLHEKEANYLRDHEWAMTDEDLFWRRTKLGLFRHP